MALLELMDRIHLALDNNKFAVGVFLDLCKAFDTINPNILLLKLHKYGIFRYSVYKW